MRSNDELDIAPSWFRWLLIGALFSSTGSNVVGLAKDSSGYTEAQARAELSLRDERITEVKRDLAQKIQDNNVSHREFESRLRAIERELAAAHRN